MRNVLVLEALGNAGDDVLAAAAELGVRTVVATHADLVDRYSPETRQKIAETVFTDFGKPEDAVQELVRHARTSGIDGVVTAWEFLSPGVTRVAAELGLPGHDPRLADACRNKRIMAEVLADNGVAAPRTFAVGTADEALEVMARGRLSYPVVIKPAENAGSVGVSVVRGPQDVADAVRQASGWPLEFPHGIPLDTAVLVQEYIGGKEFSIETVVADGEIHHLTITEKFTTSDSSRAELGHTVPAELPPSIHEQVLDTVSAALRALGLRNGLGHTELKVPDDGAPTIIELGARPPGDHIMKLVKLALGIDEARAYLQVALGDRPSVEPTRDGAAAIRFLTAPRDGVFAGVRGLPEGDPAVLSAIYVEPGTHCAAVSDNVGRLGHVIVVGDTAAEVNKLADEVLAGLTVEVA
jgi:biotin carboxylase